MITTFGRGESTIAIAADIPPKTDAMLNSQCHQLMNASLTRQFLQQSRGMVTSLV
jgi:hypothetical protein